MLNDVLLAIANLLTSALTAVTGVGGGMILIGLMPLFMPAPAIVPVHAVTQLVSNGTRAWFGRDGLDFKYFWQFFAGSLLGLLIFGVMIRFVQLAFVPLFIGVYILLITWSDKFNQLIRRFESFFLVGLIQTGLGVFVGTPGPLNIAVLNKHYTDNHVVVTTGALMMTVVHTAKLLVYISMGFDFKEYWQLLVMMVVMATLGSWLGTKLRHHIRLDWLKTLLPYLLTLLAVKLIVDIVIKHWI
ncbi:MULTISPECIES: sulfite exporter TauE/SafE family protein [unclassified Moraxella]|uniref:sulfite exporter TauE/SafE family protein n=1 Tax=unclassified Moraxella TaxID=2685852 RepID=UPI003AF4FEFA